MGDGLDDVRALLPGVPVTALEALGGSERSEVRRVRATLPGEAPSTLIVKTFAGSGEGWVRESAALSVLPADGSTPRLVADGAAPPIVVMTDAGTGPAVADALLGSDPVAAGDAVLRWADAIATLHRRTSGLRDAFAAALAARSGDWPVPETSVAADLDDTARILSERCAELDVAVPAGALAELRALPDRLHGDGGGNAGGGRAALTPADACPDNNVLAGDRLVLIDFEGAQWRHIAWDVAYLRVPWPSCWCSWRMPDELADRAVERYRAAIGSALPYVRTPAFDRDVDAAAQGWSLITASWFLGRALHDDTPLGGPAKPTPTRRAMILHRLDRAGRSAELPAVGELAGRLRAALVHRWGEVPLAYAPAFQTGGTTP